MAVVYPHLMKETRTARVRIELPNPDLALLPDMYADVEIATGSDEPVVAVPDKRGHRQRQRGRSSSSIGARAGSSRAT